MPVPGVNAECDAYAGGSTTLNLTAIRRASAPRACNSICFGCSIAVREVRNDTERLLLDRGASTTIRNAFSTALH
jgi:hypothetical protein